MHIRKHRLTPRRLSATAVVAVASLIALAGCGSSSSGGQSVKPANGGGTGSITKDAKAAAMVPSALRSSGVVRVATDASYAPNEFIGADGHTIQGMDVDLGNALGKVLGLKFEFTNQSFDTIIPALGNRYDLGISSFTDTKAREKVVTMVDYFQAGVSFIAPKGSSLNPTSVADLCGKTAAVEKGTTELDDLQAQAKKCKLTVLPFPDQNGANEALASGRADVVLADSPVAAYAVKKSAGRFQLVGQPYGTAPYGIAVPGGQYASKYQGFAQAILQALQDLNSSGAYKQILTKWGVQGGAISSFAINGAIS